MGPYAPLGGHEKEAPDPRALRLWVPFECGDVAGFFHCHEAHDGSVLDCEGRLHPGDEPPLRIDAVQHALRYESGTRRLAGGDLTLLDEEGTGHEYRFEVACPPAHPQGYGYTRGWSDGGQPGVFRGLDVIERDRFDVSDPAVAAGAPHLPPERRLGGTEFVSTIAGPGRRGGHGARRAHAVPARPPRRREELAGMSGLVQRHGLLQGQGLDLGPYTTALRARRAHDGPRPRRSRRRPSGEGLDRLRRRRPPHLRRRVGARPAGSGMRSTATCRQARTSACSCATSRSSSSRSTARSCAAAWPCRSTPNRAARCSTP